LSIDVSELRIRPADRNGPKGEGSVADAAWLVLDAASDLGDEVAVAACRRVIDAGLTGRPAASCDLQLVQDYFR
jgi:hypothetical protein